MGLAYRKIRTSAMMTRTMTMTMTTMVILFVVAVSPVFASATASPPSMPSSMPSRHPSSAYAPITEGRTTAATTTTTTISYANAATTAPSTDASACVSNVLRQLPTERCRRAAAAECSFLRRWGGGLSSHAHGRSRDDTRQFDGIQCHGADAYRRPQQQPHSSHGNGGGLLDTPQKCRQQ
mmetsp:Transcript_32282/g.67686  ORF Transcript_32282/g.67686 Transcript_32282/m.67686 type:complete len:180 (+) Transcript_32282:222-761(+)